MTFILSLGKYTREKFRFVRNYFPNHIYAVKFCVSRVTRSISIRAFKHFFGTEFYDRGHFAIGKTGLLRKNATIFADTLCLSDPAGEYIIISCFAAVVVNNSLKSNRKRTHRARVYVAPIEIPANALIMGSNFPRAQLGFFRARYRWCTRARRHRKPNGISPLKSSAIDSAERAPSRASARAKIEMRKMRACISRCVSETRFNYIRINEQRARRRRSHCVCCHVCCDLAMLSFLSASPCPPA